VKHKLAAFGLGRRGCDRYLAAELVPRPRFAFADALHLKGVQRIDLGAALPVILEAYPHRQGEEIGKAGKSPSFLHCGPPASNDCFTWEAV